MKENPRRVEKKQLFFFFLTSASHTVHRIKEIRILNLNFIIKVKWIYYLFLWHLNFGLLAPTKFKPTLLTVLLCYFC